MEVANDSALHVHGQMPGVFTLLQWVHVMSEALARLVLDLLALHS